MGASISAKQDGKTEEDATTKEQNAEVNEIPEGEDVDAKLLQKNGQISSLNGGANDQTAELNGHTEENVLAEVGQTDSVSVSQKEDGPETMETLQEEVAPQVNGEKEEKELPSADAVTSTEEEKSAEDSSGEANEVGFKKIFRFVGFKFTLKKDKNEKAEPVQLLTVKKEEGGEASGSEVAEDSKEEAATAEAQPVEEEKAAEESEPTEPAAEPAAEETPTEKVNGDATEQVQKEEEPSKEASPEREAEPVAESSTVQETQSPLRRFFTGGIFSNLRKRTSFKKPKEEEAPKEKAEDDIKETEETIESPAEEEVETSKEEVAPEPPQEESATPQEGEAEPTAEAVAPVTEEQKEDEVKVEDIPQEISEEATVAEPVEVTEAAQPTEDAKPEEEKVEEAAEGLAIPEEVPVTTAEPELLSSQEKAKVQGSPLKKLFTGSGLKKISSKKQKGKKEAEAKLTESGEQVAEQLLSSTESAEDQKEESSASSPEESGEHVIGKTTPAEASQETEGEATTSDGERKKDGILPWASFKKLVTPKKRVKRPSESEDEGAEKPKSATLSSTESAVFVEKPEEAKPSEEEPKVTLEQSTEEPKKKMDTSVSWEALICVGSAKKRARKTSDSDDEAPKIEEEVLQSGEEQVKPAESPLGSSQEADQEHLTSSPEPAGSPSEGEGVSTWESLKRFVTPRRKAKTEDKTDESTGVTEPVSSDSEIPKEESTFSLKKLIPGRRKKKGDGKQEQVSSDEAGKDVGSAEEDSDTPAVVPLSEYDAAEPEPVDIAPKEEVVSEKAAETTEAEETKPEAEPDVVKPSEVVPATAADERSPSWISPTAVEDIQETTECLTKHQQLSDIPEEGDTVATLKSTTEDVSRDDTIAEDIVEFTSEAVTAVEQVPETSVAEETTEMVSAVSRMTESAGTSGETTPVPGEAEEKKTEAMLQEAVSLIPNELSVTMKNEQPEAIPVTVLPQVVEVATKIETPVLVSHQQSEATSICTGLESQEIESAEEETLKVSIESITEVSEVMTTELALEDKTEKTEEADVTEDKVYEAESQEVKMEIQETQPSAEPEAEDAKEVEAVEEAVTELQEQLPLENALDEAVEMGQIKEEQEVAELANELSEVQPVSVAVVNAVQGKAEHVEAVVFTENTQKTEAEGPAEVTVEESVYAQTLQVTEVPALEAEKVQELDDVKESSADAELAPVEEVVEVTKQEVTASMPEPAADETSGIEETPIPVVAPAEEFPVVKETVSIINPLSESIQSEEAEMKDEAVLERVPSVQFTDDHKIQVEVKDTDNVSAEAAIEAEIEVASSNMTAIVQEAQVEVKEMDQLCAEAVVEAEIEAVSTNITAVVDEVCEKVEDMDKLSAETVVEAKIEAASISVSTVVDEVSEKEEDTSQLSAEAVVEAEIKAASTSVSTVVHEVCEKVEDTDKLFAEAVVEAKIEAASTSVTTVVEEVCEKVEEAGEPMHAEPGEEVAIEEQSTVIVQTIIQSVVQNLSETTKELESQEVKETETPAPENTQVVEEAPTILTKDEKPVDANAQVEMQKATDKTVVGEVKDKSEDSEVLEKEEVPAITEKPPKQIQEAVQVLQVLPIEETQAFPVNEVQQETVSVDFEGGGKQVAEVTEVPQEEVKILEEQIEKAKECLVEVVQKDVKTVVSDTLERVEEVQNERESKKSESQKKKSEDQEEAPQAEAPKDAQPSQDVAAGEVEVTKEVPSEEPVADTPCQTEVVADSSQPEMKEEAWSQDEVTLLAAEPDVPAEAQATDSQTPSDTAQKATAEVAQDEAHIQQAQMMTQEVQILEQIQIETVEEFSLNIEKAPAGDDAVPAVSQDQPVAQTSTEESQTNVPSTAEEEKVKDQTTTATNAVVEDVKCTELTMPKKATEITVEVIEETVNEIEPVSTELTAAS